MNLDKKLVMVIADHPLSPSGVGIQTKYFIEAMLKTGKYRFICFGGAVKHNNYSPVKVDPYGDDWIIFPVDGYGTQEMLRACISQNKPDVLWIMTDPRFYGWLWEIENELRSVVPLVYYHVWDNKPAPKFNKTWYDSNDVVVSISKLTSEVVREVSPDVEEHYLPHAVDMSIFRKLADEEIAPFKSEAFGNISNLEDKTIFFWNNRNARRKQSGSLIWWFKKFLDNVGHDQAILLMHTDPKDVHGQDLLAIMTDLGLTNGEVMLSTKKVAPEHLSLIYNAVDCTVNISDAEGFGLATFESLACETPVIVNMTGGLQEQVTDGVNWFGIGIEPTSKAIIGSQEVPYIYEDRLDEQSVVDALTQFHNFSKQERALMGKLGRKHLNDNYHMSAFGEKWDEIISGVIENRGSWDTRKNYQAWELREV